MFLMITFEEWLRKRPIPTSLPLRPIIDLLEPTMTLAAPVMVPETTTIRGVVSATALVSAANVLTVTVEPPFPPDVLRAGN